MNFINQMELLFDHHEKEAINKYMGEGSWVTEFKKIFGRIINFFSVVSQKSKPGVSVYAASKPALWGLTKSIAIENAGNNININGNL